jgi:hypothetical protein
MLKDLLRGQSVRKIVIKEAKKGFALAQKIGAEKIRTGTWGKRNPTEEDIKLVKRRLMKGRGKDHWVDVDGTAAQIKDGVLYIQTI